MLEKGEYRPPGEGHAIIARLDYVSTGQRSRKVDSVTQYPIPQGQALVFVGEDPRKDPILCSQERVPDIVSALPPEQRVPLVAIVDNHTGTLFVIQGPENRFEIGPETPRGEQVKSTEIGSSEFGCIWGNTKSQVEQNLRMFIPMRTR